MIVERPFNAEDNEVNEVQIKMIKNWAKINNEEIVTLKIYEAAVNATILSGRNIIVNITEGRGGHRRISHYMYMKERINGKFVRIKI